MLCCETGFASPPLVICGQVIFRVSCLGAAFFLALLFPLGCAVGSLSTVSLLFYSISKLRQIVLHLTILFTASAFRLPVACFGTWLLCHMFHVKHRFVLGVGLGNVSRETLRPWFFCFLFHVKHWYCFPARLR